MEGRTVCTVVQRSAPFSFCHSERSEGTAFPAKTALSMLGSECVVIDNRGVQRLRWGKRQSPRAGHVLHQCTRERSFTARQSAVLRWVLRIVSFRK